MTWEAKKMYQLDRSIRSRRCVFSGSQARNHTLRVTALPLQAWESIESRTQEIKFGVGYSVMLSEHGVDSRIGDYIDTKSTYYVLKWRIIELVVPSELRPGCA